ncbi:MAG: DUF92 domain-containing protein [Methanosarcinales archaeon]|nr:DUF92 domain-containing protein [Methanosarcinales archaeon]
MVAYLHLIFFLILAVLLPFIPIEHLLRFLLVITLILIMIRDRKSEITRAILGISSALFILGIIDILMVSSGYKFPLYIISASICITCAGSAVASLIKSSWKSREIEDKSIAAVSSIGFIVIGAVLACIISYWTVGILDLHVTLSQLFFLTLLGSVTGALLESIPSKTDKNFILILGTSMVMWLFASFGYYVNFDHLTTAFVFSLVLAYLAYRLDIADVSAMHAATLLGVLIIVFTNINWYLVLITFFLLGGGFTRYRYAYKIRKGIAQSKHGVRSYINVLSNSTAALFLAILYGVYHGLYPQFSIVLMFGYLGSVATATGDTLASEIGVTNKGKPIMITTLKPVEPGTDGAVSLLGEVVCILGSLIIGLLALVLVINMESLSLFTYIIWVLIIVLGGFAGTNFDSLLGATLQQRGYLSNSGVNFFSTFFGAFISGAAYYLLSGHVV